jgi:putative membrane protein
MSAIKQFAFAVLVSMAAMACNGDNDRASREAAPGGGTAGTTGTTDIAMGDRNFVKDMAADGQAEIGLGEMAQQKATDPDVKAFAAMMVRDHSKAGEELKSIAAKHNIELNADLDDQAKDLREQLAKKSGAEFDRDYIKAMVDDHEQAVDDAKDKAEHSDNPEIKQWASKTLPTLQQHLERAKQISSALEKH